MSKIVITGGPYSGKTTFINHLSKWGVRTIPEAAILVIDEGAKAVGSDAFKKWRSENILGFQLLIAEKQRQLESSIIAAQTTFLDRSLVDCIAYLEYNSIHCPIEYDLLKTEGYKLDHVLLFDTLPDFDSRLDTGRLSTIETSLGIRDKLYEVYSRLGYEVSFIGANNLETRNREICRVLNVTSTSDLV